MTDDPIPDGVPAREAPKPQTHEHWAPAIPAEDVPAFIYDEQQRGWVAAAVFVTHDPAYRCVVLKRELVDVDLDGEVRACLAWAANFAEGSRDQAPQALDNPTFNRWIERCRALLDNPCRDEEPPDDDPYEGDGEDHLEREGG